MRLVKMMHLLVRETPRLFDPLAWETNNKMRLSRGTSFVALEKFGDLVTTAE